MGYFFSSDVRLATTATVRVTDTLLPSSSFKAIVLLIELCHLFVPGIDMDQEWVSLAP